jgi:hypothetical protein
METTTTATRVINLAHPEQVRIYTCSPTEAVIAAWRQSLHDWDTADYGKYADQVVHGKVSVRCGDWCAMKRAEVAK